MRRALKAATLALAITATAVIGTTTPAAQAGRWTPVATFTLDANGTSLPATQVAADWSKGTNVLVRAGTCSGARCIKLTEPVNPTHCTPPGMSVVLGCAGFTLEDGSCGVEVYTFLRDYADARRHTTAHEVGHCLGMKHLADPRALMYPTSDFAPRIVAPTRTDKSALNSLYPR